MKKKLLSLCLVVSTLISVANAQSIDNLKSILKSVTTSNSNSTSSTNKNISSSDANTGVKQVLTNGLLAGVANLSKTDAFYKTAYRILLPEPLNTADKTLRKIGLSSVADSTELRMNHAAEDAVTLAKPIFLNAISSMSVTDAVGLVTGGSNSITTFFKNKTYQTLVNTFTPKIKTELDKNKSTSYYSSLVTQYNMIPFVKKADPKLENYVATKAVDALFDQIGKQEVTIRNNPAAQTTSVLKSIFGSK